MLKHMVRWRELACRFPESMHVDAEAYADVFAAINESTKRARRYRAESGRTRRRLMVARDHYVTGVRQWRGRPQTKRFENWFRRLDRLLGGEARAAGPERG